MFILLDGLTDKNCSIHTFILSYPTENKQLQTDDIQHFGFKKIGKTK